MNDPALRKVCEPVVLEEMPYINSLVSDMLSIMEEEQGIALAANQVGVIKRFFVMKNGTLVVNPEIVELGPVSSFEEGCLSIPGTSAVTQRAKHIKLRYKDRSFNDVEAEYNGVDAVAVQHEIDHLDGKLYTDQLPAMRRQLTLDKHRKYMRRRSR
jgi:peptide deformylase